MIFGNRITQYNPAEKDVKGELGEKGKSQKITISNHTTSGGLLNFSEGAGSK